MKLPNTTGELREYLAGCMEDVRTGALKIEQAREVAKIASQITDSLRVEVQLSAVAKAFGESPPTVGALTLGEPDTEVPPARLNGTRPQRALAASRG